MDAQTRELDADDWFDPTVPALSGPTVLHRWPWGYISPKTFHAWTVRGEQGEEKRMLNLRQLIRKFGIVPLVVTLLSFPAAAQRVELFGGYQFTHLQPAFNANGWDASITGNFKHILGITGDFSGAYERGVHAYTYTGGPVLTARLPVVQPFVHALFGGMTVGGGTSSSTSGFTMMFGGGLDIGMRKGIGFRVVQADWISTNFSGTTRNRNVRASTGLVIKF
ncbi:MAG: hypothetical protein DMG78_13575 [Acidobacteria bacterium]|nr:MAG: hypothetical protein DMG78_13575 [Acidobacteriota bacterium]